MRKHTYVHRELDHIAGKYNANIITRVLANLLCPYRQGAVQIRISQFPSQSSLIESILRRTKQSNRFDHGFR